MSVPKKSRKTITSEGSKGTQIKKKALELGFDLIAITPAPPSKTINFYWNWLKYGYAGKMTYLERHYEKKKDIQLTFPGTKSIISLAINYNSLSPFNSSEKGLEVGIISRYAWGDDYHEIIQDKLEKLRDFIHYLYKSCNTRIYVDTGPLLEREYAHQGGLGWIGKNANLIHWKIGSWLFIGEILIDAELPLLLNEYRGSCGSCTKCIEACPTNAIIEDRTVDARRCISYLTIELKEAIPEKFRTSLANLIFGCDICQEVCPWNRKVPISSESGFHPRSENLFPELIPLMFLTQNDFNKRFQNSPIKRTKRRGFLRNVAIALGNWGNIKAIPALEHGIKDQEPLVRSHAAWALGQIPSSASYSALEEAVTRETDKDVLLEIKNALFKLKNKHISTLNI